MKPIFPIGQQAIKVGNKRYLFTPSFRNIANVSEPKDLISIFHLMTDKDADIVAVCGHSNDVMSACAVDDLPDDLLWSLASSWDGKRTVMKEGLISLSAQIIMSADLLYMGMVGNPPKMRQKSSNKEMKEFNCIEYVSIAVAQLGFTPAQAWEITMVDFQKAMEAKYPELFAPKDIPNKTELDLMSKDADAAIERLNALRGVKSA